MSVIKQKTSVKLLLLFFFIIIFWFIARFFRFDIDGLENFLKRFPVYYSGLIFIVLYVIGTFFIWLSKDIFRFIAAILFGPYLSTLFIWVAETINAFVLFYIARFLGREFVVKYFNLEQKEWGRKIENVSLFWLFLFRLTPLIPFRFLDLACGLTAIDFRKYLSVVVLASPLRILWVQYVLSGVGKGLLNNPLTMAEYLLKNKALYIFSLIYLLLVIIVVLKMRRKGGMP